MLSVNLLENNIRINQAEALVSMLKDHPTLQSLCGNRGDEIALDMSGKKMGASSAVMLAAEIVGNGALTSLDISENGLYAEGTKLLAAALKSNQIMTALNISSNAMTFDGEDFGDTSGVAALADAISGMGAISSVNLLKNTIGIDQTEAFVSMLNDHPTLKSLCGNKGNETELDMSGKMNSPEDATMLVAEIAGNGTMTMTSLNLASNSLGIEGAKIIAAFLPKCT
jgi:hypothetical protein